MRVLHTADWHLGRVFAGFDLLETQRHALDGIVAIAAAARPDAILVAGDLYDRAVPPEDAVLLLDDTFLRLSRIAPVLAIAGNHDSGRRIDFGRRLMREAGVHLAGTSRSGVEGVEIADRHGAVRFHLLPYATPEEARFETGRDDVRTHDDATRARIAGLEMAPGRNVLVAHLFAQGGQETQDSERDISVGGASSVATDAFGPFCYTALGHLHRPHALADGRVRYSGSLCRYSFAEAEHRKTVSLVEIDAAGQVTVEEVEIPQRFGMRTLRGGFDALLEAAAADPDRDRDLVRIALTDAIVVPGARERLRDLYPNLLEFTVERAGDPLAPTGPDTAAAVRTRSPHEFVARFLDDRYPGVADDAIRSLARGCMERAVAGEEPA
jgi:exonuclease SbcD